MGNDLDGTVLATVDQCWVCSACGKQSRTRFGYDKDGKRVCNRGWDGSCMLNAVLCYERELGKEQWQAVEVTGG